jgi:sialic acid synthase SpsE
VKIGKKAVSAGNPAFIIAEVASAHGGDAEACRELAKKAGQAGADAVKFQVFRAGELVASTDKRFGTFSKIELSGGEWKKTISSAKKLGIEVLADVFDEESLELMDSLGVSAFKIHSTDLENPRLISQVAEKRKPVLLSTGGATPEEIRGAISTIKSHGNNGIILIHGFQNYPTRVEDTNLRMLQALKNDFGLDAGYHDHVDAESPLALVLPCMAVAMGACVLEKHITLNRSLKGYDYQSALNPDEFGKMVKLVREAEASLGSGPQGLTEAEKQYRASTRRSIVAARDIPAGAAISSKMLAFKRSEPGLPPSEASKLEGKKAKALIKKDELVTWVKLS